MKVRAATMADASALGSIHVLGWRVGYRGLLPQDLLDALSVEEVVRRREACLEAEAAAVRPTLLVESNGVPRGFSIFGLSRDDDATATTGELYALYVHPDAWGRGYGRALLDRSVDELRARGFTELTLWVLRSNERACRFYEAWGLRPDGGEKVETKGDFVLDEVRHRYALS